jgi:excinuclease ABC subunit A
VVFPSSSRVANCGGDEGGKIMAVGTPEEVAKVKDSYTGQYLKKML